MIDMNDYTLDELDYQILQLIANDARISFLEVSRICNVSGAAVHQRVQKMISNQIITGSEFLLNMPKIGYNTCAYLTIHFAETINIEEVTEKIKEISEIVECHILTGVSNLFVKIYAQNNSRLFDIIQNQLKPLGAIKVESMISCRESFHRQISNYKQSRNAN